MRNDARIVTRVASCALILVFIALLVFTVMGGATIDRAANQTKAAVELSERYEFIERELWKEASLVRVHGVRWQNADWYENVFEEHAAAVAIQDTLWSIAASGSQKDRDLANKTLADHARYTTILVDLFSEIDSNVPAAAGTFEHSARLFDVMQAHIDRRASEQHTLAIAALAQLDRTQARIVQLDSTASLIGAILLAISVFVILRYRRIIEHSRTAELERLAEVSLTDTLTGLGNHRAYQNDVERELANSERHGHTVSLALIDIDNFKSVNDIKGHIQGDEVLAAVGRLLLGLRKGDRGFRLGGDEFAVLLPHSEPADALVTMERLRQDAAASLEGSTVSIGIASTTAHDVDALTLRANADAALYAAKHRGRNNAITYEDAGSHSFVRSSEKKSALRQLLVEGHFEVVFQPVCDIDSQSPVGFAASVCPAGKYGFESAQEAFSLAEEMGLASMLDAVSLPKILASARELSSDSLLFLNVVPDTLNSELFTDGAVEKALANSGFSPERIVIELTARSPLHLDTIGAAAKRLQGRGLKIALDNVATVHAGPAVLRTLAVDFVKIDAAVVLQAKTDPIAQAIVTGVIDVACAMQSDVVVEGFDTQRALQLVRRELAARAMHWPMPTPYGSVAAQLPGRTEDSAYDPRLGVAAF